MHTLSSPLLARLLDRPAPPGEGKVDFSTALHQLGVTSVFDIVRLPRADFIRQLGRVNDDDGAQAYDTALAYATQLQWLYELQPTDTPPARSKRELDASGSSLLAEDWANACAPDALAALDSPVAYLRTLYLFARQLEQNGVGTCDKVLLSQRRPDLEALVIDHDSTFTQRPLLTLVDDMLRKHIKYHHPRQKLYRLLSTQHYPLTLPYHHHHYQCRLGLDGTRHRVGELNYRISKRLPFDAAGSAQYGWVQTHNPDVQCLLSDLNPGLQTLLLQPPLEAGTLFQTCFGLAGAPQTLQALLDATALNTAQLHALLAEERFAPHASPSVKDMPLPLYGARYVNGTDESPMTVASNNAQLLNITDERFDRLQRMIRLQHGVDLPFAELDTLIVSAMACERPINADLRISHGTLRALGVFRYLNRRYALTPLAFSAWLDRVPLQASATAQPLFDQVFNPTPVGSQPLPLDDQVLDRPTRQRLCAALELTDTPNSLHLLIDACPTPVLRNLATYSALYRQAHIARTFGLSVQHCRQLADLLGPATWSHLTAPTLRSGERVAADFLDGLMQLDWAVTWLKDSHISVPLLRQRLLLEPVSDNPALARWVDLLRHPPYELPSAWQLAPLPQPATADNLPPIEWAGVLAQAFGASADLSQPRQPSLALDQAISTLSLSPVPAQDAVLKQQAKDRLTPWLQRIADKGQRVCIQQLLDTPVPTPYSKELTLYYNQFLNSAKTPPALKHLILLAPDVTTLLALPVADTSLRQLLLNPHWLDRALAPSTLLQLNLGTLYLLQRFKACCDTWGLTQDELLDFFRRANGNGAQPLDTQLSHWLGWSETELRVLTDTLPTGRVTAMDQLDWILRCHQACAATRLPCQALLDASHLSLSSDFSQWKALGEAVIAARH
ncbi:Tc toxin subunit A [Pseudomonas rhodesiae]|uniref:Tc toxin subunit A n=1 Tax=Pseudomonas rhodesiae TaxID=76760 RepID=UPI00241D4B88|nr:Tc toxin subunit A [Pseudomonas rhodesiae]